MLHRWRCSNGHECTDADLQFPPEQAPHSSEVTPLSPLQRILPNGCPVCGAQLIRYDADSAPTTPPTPWPEHALWGAYGGARSGGGSQDSATDLPRQPNREKGIQGPPDPLELEDTYRSGESQTSGGRQTLGPGAHHQPNQPRPKTQPALSDDPADLPTESAPSGDSDDELPGETVHDTVQGNPETDEPTLPTSEVDVALPASSGIIVMDELEETYLGSRRGPDIQENSSEGMTPPSPPQLESHGRAEPTPPQPERSDAGEGPGARNERRGPSRAEHSESQVEQPGEPPPISMPGALPEGLEDTYLGSSPSPPAPESASGDSLHIDVKIGATSESSPVPSSAGLAGAVPEGLEDTYLGTGSAGTHGQLPEANPEDAPASPAPPNPPVSSSPPEGLQETFTGFVRPHPPTAPQVDEGPSISNPAESINPGTPDGLEETFLGSSSHPEQQPPGAEDDSWPELPFGPATPSAGLVAEMGSPEGSSPPVQWESLKDDTLNPSGGGRGLASPGATTGGSQAEDSFPSLDWGPSLSESNQEMTSPPAPPGEEETLQRPSTQGRGPQNPTGTGARSTQREQPGHVEAEARGTARKPGGIPGEQTPETRVPQAPARTGGHDVPPTEKLAGAGAQGQGADTGSTEGSGYEILGVLGRGGMGVVYRARQVALNRVVALKMILAGSHAGEEDLVRFRTEAEAVARLQHPNIVQVYEVGEREGKPYFSLEYVSGGSLHGRLKGAPLPPREAGQLLATLARAIHFAHQRGIVHRDLKPANVLLALREDLVHQYEKQDSEEPPDYQKLPLGAFIPKITDFGLAKRLDQEDGHTGTEAVLGTPTYMAPEQASGQTRDVGPAADIYALGAVLYDLLTGRPPFRGSTVLDTLHQVIMSEPVPPRNLQPGVELDLQTICLKCLEKDPRKRYETAEELARDLDRYLGGEPIHARPVSPAEKAVKWARRRPALAGLLSLSVVVVLGLIVGGISFAFYEMHRANEALRLQKKAQDAEEATRKKNTELRATQQTLRQERDNLRTTQEKLREQFELALKARKEAQKNFLSVQEAITELIQVSQKHLRNAPKMEKERESLLSKAIQLTEGFLDRKDLSPEVRLRSARAYRHQGDLHKLLGKPTEAQKSYQAAIDLYVELIEKTPVKDWIADYRKELSDVLVSMWIVMEGNDSQAGLPLRKALKILREGTTEELHSDRKQWQKHRVHSLASIYNNHGIYHHNQGKLDEAQNAYQEANKLFGQLHQKYPGSGRYALELARTKVNLGVVLAHNRPDRPGLARESYEKALGLLTPLVRRHRKEPIYAKELARTYSNLGLLLQNDPKTRAQAEEAYRKAVVALEKLTELFPYTADYQHLLALAKANLGRFLLSLENRETEGEKELQQACEKLLKLKENHPEVLGYQKDLSLALTSLGMAQLEQKQWAEGRLSLVQALGLARNLVQQEKENPSYRDLLSSAHKNLISVHDLLARELARRKQIRQAEGEVRKLVLLRQDLLDHFPKNARYRSELGSTLLTRADLLLKMGRYSEANETMSELLRVVPKDWPKLTRSAGIYARCMQRASRDTSLTASQRKERIRTYGRRAMNLLQQAARQGTLDRSYVRSSPDFLELRTHEDFRRDFEELTAGRSSRSG